MNKGDHLNDNFTVAAELGRGREVSDDELFYFVRGEVAAFSELRYRELVNLFQTEPWSSRLAKEQDCLEWARAFRDEHSTIVDDQTWNRILAETEADHTQARSPSTRGQVEWAAPTPPQQRELDNPGLWITFRRSLRWRTRSRTFAVVGAAASLAVVIAIFAITRLGDTMSSDMHATVSAGRALAVFSVEARSERVRHVDMSPDRTSVDRTQPTLRWSALDAKVRVVEVVLSKDDMRIASTTDVQAGSWTVSQNLLNQSRYTWTLRYEVDQEQLEADATFYVPCQEAINFANGLNGGLSGTKRASLLIELDRLPEAIRVLDKVLEEQNADVKVMDAARQLRQDAEATLRKRRG